MNSLKIVIIKNIGVDWNVTNFSSRGMNQQPPPYNPGYGFAPGYGPPPAAPPSYAEASGGVPPSSPFQGQPGTYLDILIWVYIYG